MRKAQMLFLATVLVMIGVLSSAAGDGQPTPDIRVFADLEHTGKLSGPVPHQPKAVDVFVIVAPLPVHNSQRDLLPETTKDGDDIVGRLGRLRIEAKEGNNITISKKGEPGAALRLYRRTLECFCKI